MENLLEQYVRRAGWRPEKSGVWRSPNKRRFIFYGEERAQPASRYLSALLSEAHLRARAAVEAHPGAIPVAYLQLDRVTPLIEQRLIDFVDEVAGDEPWPWLVFDQQGTFLPHVAEAPDLEAIRAATVIRPAPRRVNLFSDHNQWLLKVLLAQKLPGHIRSVPGPFRSASALAEAA